MKTIKELMIYASNQIADWGLYASEYFQEKWHLKEDIQEFKDLAEKYENYEDKLLLEFFLYFRRFGEEKIGQSMEQFINEFLEHRE